ncbi:MAG: DUF72 domain-containing protein [Candidatus Omnitrophota bacterium]|nr:MAG: DUF72 domain-containing protein [Candidatus Omnitrophota bacterium]
MKKRILVGTSGYNYEHWKGVFYPKDIKQNKWLQFYSQHFNTVELNVTFYRLPQKKAFQSWYQRTPKNFAFVIKGSRYITHIKRLNACSQPLNLFFKNAAPLKEKLFCVLWQLPPSLKFDLKRLENFVLLLKKKYSSCRHSFEFRHESWFNDTTYELLKDNNINLCIAHSPNFPAYEVALSNFIYLRFHGGEQLYSSNYTDSELKNWAQKAKKLSKGKSIIFAFFNNDAQGFAIKNALKFRKLLNEKL